MSEHADRRRFLKACGLTVAASLGPTAGARLARATEKGRANMIPIVDTHQHLWDLDKFRLPWLKNVPALARSYRPDDYRKATEGLNIVKAIYMEVDLDPAQQVEEAEFVIDLCQRGGTPTVAGVISGRPASDAFPQYIRRFKDNRYIKGVRQVLHPKETPAGLCLAPQFIKSIQLLGELGLRYDLCMRSGELADGVKLIEACPATRFVLDHCGNADIQTRDRSQWQRDMAAIAKQPNVVGKVSGIIVSAKPGQWTADNLAPFINHTLDVFGPDRVMFGGDWPVCTQTATYRQWVEALQSIVKARREEEQRKLFHDNAVKFYELG
jgi:predicted TIM-barrel fold metal-dependent hydrolase